MKDGEAYTAEKWRKIFLIRMMTIIAMIWADIGIFALFSMMAQHSGWNGFGIWVVVSFMLAAAIRIWYNPWNRP